MIPQSFEENSYSKKTKKKIRISNFRGQPIVSDDYAKLETEKLAAGLEILLNNEDPNLSLEELHRSVVNLVEFHQREAAFKVLCSANHEYLSAKLEELLMVSQRDLLDHLVSLWIYYSNKIFTIKNVYLSYDRSSRNDSRFNAVQTTCTALFKNIIMLNPDISKNVTSELLNAMRTERLGSAIDTVNVEIVLGILIQLNLYEELFETKFLADSQRYFHEEGLNFMENRMQVSGYLWHISSKAREETVRNYVRKQSTKKVLHILYKEMVETHIEEILTQGFQQLMDENSLPTLHLMYSLINSTSKGVSCMVEYFQRYSHSIACKIVKSGAGKSMIQNLMDFKEKLDKIIEQCFHGNKLFYDISKMVFEKVINMKNSDSCLYLSKYLDSKLRSKNLNEKDLKMTLQQILFFFRLIQGKDLFEAFYRKDLAKRLIFDTSTSQDMEQSVVVKFKEECGETFTSTIEGMLKDIELSKTINATFKAYLANTQCVLMNNADANVVVLTSSFWSKVATKSTLIIPDDLLNYQDVFSKHYTSIHTGKKLHWQPHLAYCLVRVNFNNGVKELQVSLYQTVILLLFNDYNKLSLSEIQNLTKLEFKHLIATLHSLSCGKYKILIKEPQNPASVDTKDTFAFNAQFTEKLFRIKVNQAQFRETVDEQKATESSVLADRQFQIDAAIVRILKSKKIVTHNELLAELFKILDIPIRSQVLKKRIELLIEREFIKRDVDNVASYIYVA